MSYWRHHNHTLGYLYCSISILAVSLAFPLVEYLFRTYPDISPAQGFFWGSLVAVLVPAPYIVSSRKERNRIAREIRSHGWLVLTISSLTAFGGLLWFVSMSLSNSGIITLLGKSEPLYAFVFGIFLLNERITKGEVIAFTIALSGIVCISSISGEISLFGVLLILVSRLCYALQSVLVKKFGSEIDGIAFAYIRAIVMTSWLGVYNFFANGIALMPLSALVLVGCSQLFGLFIGRIFYFEAHKHLPITTIHTMHLIEPVLVVCMGLLLFQHSFTSQKAIGMGLIVCGLFLFFREKWKARIAQA